MYNPTTAELVDVGIRALRSVQSQIRTDVANNAARFFRRTKLLSNGKPALAVDIDAEDSFEREIHKYQRQKFKDIVVHGEESLATEDLDLTNAPGVIALADIVDGTDLLERGLGNWCSAVVFFSPTNRVGKRIRAALVALPDDRIYFARDDKKGAFVKNGNDDEIPVAGPSKINKIADASICFYGQKIKNFTQSHLALMSKGTLSKYSEMRLYNLAGMPMIAKLIDQGSSSIRGIDVVFDVCGQQPHDVVPGAFIAKKAKAIIKGLDGNDIGLSELERLLMKPTSTRLSYVIAATEELAQEMVALLTESPAK